MGNALLVALVNPPEGEDAAYAAWYADFHIPELGAVPVVLSARMHTAIDFRESAWRHAAIYELDGDPVAALSRIGEDDKAGKITPCPVGEPSSRFVGFATPIADRIGAPHDPDNLLFVVLTNPVEGEDDEYNRWYNEVHAPDVVAVDGFVGVQRFRMSSLPGMPAPHWNYLALYEIDRHRLEEAFDNLGKAAGTERMVISPALKPGDIGLGYYQLTTARAKAPA